MRLPLWRWWTLGRRIPKVAAKPDAKRAPGADWDLDAALLEWTAGQSWSIRDAFEGLLCLGRSGSGKTSGPARLSAMAMLTAGFGGLVMVAKSSEVEQWREYCRLSARSDDLVVITPGGPWRFNPLAHALASTGGGSGHVESLVHLFSIILEIADRESGQGGQQSSEAYWRQACRQMIRNFLGLLILATGTVSINDLYRAITSAPRSPEELASQAWQAGSYCMQLMRKADSAAKTDLERHDWGLITAYILEELVHLASRTRSVITSTFTSMIDVMQRGILFDLFGRDTTITPDAAAEQGKVIVVDVGIKEHGQIGLIANGLLKHAFFRSIERRDVRLSPRPVFFFADEAHYFITGHDALFLTTTRSARVAPVLISQSVSNFYSALGSGEKGRAEADSIFTNLNTKVFCANGDSVTNEWASAQIGEVRQFFQNSGQSHSGDDWFETVAGLGQSSQSNAGISEQMSPELPAQRFTMLRTGGPVNRGLIDAIVYQSGRTFGNTGRTWTPATFKQAGM